MQLVSGLLKRPDTTPSNSVATVSAKLVDGVWITEPLLEDGGYRPFAAGDSYGADLGSAQRVVKIQLSGVSTNAYGPCQGYFNVTPVIRIFESENNSYWTEKGESEATLAFYGSNDSYSLLIYEFGIPENVIVRSRYIKAVVKVAGYVQFTNGAAEISVNEIAVFGLEGTGSGDLPFIESGADAIYCHGNNDLPFFDCYYYSGTGDTDLPFFDLVAKGWVETLAESDLPFFDGLAGVNASAYTDLLFYDTKTLNFTYGQVTGEASVDLPFFDSEGLYNSKYNGDLPFYDSEILAFTKGSSGLGFTDLPFYDSISLNFKKGIGGTSKVDLPFFDSGTIKVLHITKGKTDLPFFESVSTVGIIGIPGMPGDEIPVSQQLSLRYYNVF